MHTRHDDTDRGVVQDCCQLTKAIWASGLRLLGEVSRPHGRGLVGHGVDRDPRYRIPPQPQPPPIGHTRYLRGLRGPHVEGFIKSGISGRAVPRETFGVC